MDTSMIILVLAGLVVFGLIYRSVSSKPEKTTGGGSAPTQPSQEELLSLSKVELLEMADSLSLSPAKSLTKTKIVQMIIIEMNDRSSTN